MNLKPRIEHLTEAATRNIVARRRVKRLYLPVLVCLVSSIGLTFIGLSAAHAATDSVQISCGMR